ncbi:MAG: hypothetical protein AAFY73_05945 [Pseudomonadota bacterium]
MKSPAGIDERPEQIRPPVLRAEGGTEAERFLAALAEKSFLNLWSYPTPYRDQKLGGRGDGKELCDLLVVCGRHVLIFSEKTISWPNGDLGTAWSRWAKRALRDSAKQVAGAERWLAGYADRIFLDKACTQHFPIALPGIEEREVHHVLVANGAIEACLAHRPNGEKSFKVSPGLKGHVHWSPSLAGFEPFAVGDINPEGAFVHVFNEAALQFVMDELDTITDFTDYLSRKAEFVRSGMLATASSEEALVARFATCMNSSNEHAFLEDHAQTSIVLTEEPLKRLLTNPQYRAKKLADEVSYLWDRLIENFTNHMLAGTAITLPGHTFELSQNELAVRYMALVPRTTRRAHSLAVQAAMRRGINTSRFFRAIITPPSLPDHETAFFLCTLKYDAEFFDGNGGYASYRQFRAGLAEAYAQGLLEKLAYLQRVVGIMVEPPQQGRGSSEDLIYAEQSEWSEEARVEIKARCEAFGILQNYEETPFSVQEYPEVDEIIVDLDEFLAPRPSMNRRQRRAAVAKARRSGRA